jgi:hypothetical protein
LRLPLDGPETHGQAGQEKYSGKYAADDASLYKLAFTLV